MTNTPTTTTPAPETLYVIGAENATVSTPDVSTSAFQQIILQTVPPVSLAGTWRFALDPADIGTSENWPHKRLPDSIFLPGSTDEGGYGEPEAPSLHHLTRRHMYIGAAWYQTDVEVPETWRGKQISISFERCMWETQVWLDGARIGARDSLCTPHKYTVSECAEPGRHTLTVRVDNSARPGASCHGYGDDIQGYWNGLIGRLEVQCRDHVSIDQIQAYPDFVNRSVRIVVTINNKTKQTISGQVGVRVALAGSPMPGDPTEAAQFLTADERFIADCVVHFDSDVQPWNEFTPNLYSATVDIVAENPEASYSDAKTTQFGFRDFTSDGTNFFVNGSRIFLRGTHDAGNFPLTGYPSMDTDEWRRIYRIGKEYGLNHFRFHSWCPPEAAFEAADLEGIYLQPELPYWGNVRAGWAGTAFLRAELKRILDTYGNHPSFCLFSMGNEHEGDWDVLAGFVAEAKRHDPRHLYAAASNQYIRRDQEYGPVTPGDEFATPMFGQMAGHKRRPRLRYEERFPHESPATDKDYDDIVNPHAGVPQISHEVGQWWVYPNYKEIEKYTGIYYAHHLEHCRDSLAAKGMAGLDASFSQSTGKFAAILYREEMERIFRSRLLAGFQLLDLHDYPGQGMALVGVLDSFWDSKGIITPDEWKQSCDQTVLLARFAKRTWSNTETLTTSIEVCHYGPVDLTDVAIAWQVLMEDGTPVAAGSLSEAPLIKTGGSTHLGKIAVALNDIFDASKIRVDIHLTSHNIRNVYDLWVYPDCSSDIDTAVSNVHIAYEWDDIAQAVVACGGTVLLAGHELPSTEPIGFPGSFWVTLRTLSMHIESSHPAFRDFPTDHHTNWQWWELTANARAFCLTTTSSDFSPIIYSISSPFYNVKQGVLFEAKVGKGRLLACSLDIVTDLDNRIVARQLRRSLIEYASSPDFCPRHTLSIREVANLVTWDGVQLVDAPPTGAALLDVRAAVHAPAGTTSQWSAECDEVRARAAGFDYLPEPGKALCRRTEAATSWTARIIDLTITCPPGFAGTLYVHLVTDNEEPYQEIISHLDRPACFDSNGSPWIAASVDACDTTTGSFNLRFERLFQGTNYLKITAIDHILLVGSDD
ncbi:MAG TPA: hypothetical protein VGK19_16585 [Capsulimonadaceae bacterium]|jgi:hypothetical protein